MPSQSQHRSSDVSIAKRWVIRCVGAAGVLLLLFITACHNSTHEPTTLTGTLRYQATTQTLEATLQLSPAETLLNAPVPTLFGSPLAALPAAGKGTYRTRRQLSLPSVIQLTVPAAGQDRPIDLAFVPLYADSLPATLSNTQTAAFPVAATGLTEKESIVVFFEPPDRSAPRRLQLVGPTSTGILTLPARALSDVPPGPYEVYLIKQQLTQDSTENLVYSLQTEYFTRSRPVIVTD